MSKKQQDSALRQIFQLGEEVMSGRSRITAEDIDRFRHRHEGPNGHPLLLRSERLPRGDGRLADLAMAPDGSPCVLWRPLALDVYQGMEVQVGKKVWRLNPRESSWAQAGRIIGFSWTSAPIIHTVSSGDMLWVKGDQTSTLHAQSHTTIYIGDQPLEHTRSCHSELAHVGWTMGFNTRLLYCMRRSLQDPSRYQLVGYDPDTGEERVASERPGPIRTEGPSRLVVVDHMIYAFETKDRTVTIYAPWLDQPKVVSLDKGVDIASHGRSIWQVSAKGGFELLAHEEPWPYAKVQRERNMPLDGYIRGMHFASGKAAYVAKRPHGLEGWNQGTQQHPGFERVTDLHCESGHWSYWGLADGHLFLMELPNVPDRT